MMPRQTQLPGAGRLLAAVILLAGAAAPARADLKKDTSLAVIPADAAFYASSLRNKEQIDLFYNSNAYKTLRELPFVKEAWNELMKKGGEKGGPLEGFHQFMEDKGNKELVDLLLEGAGEELFFYGGKSWIDFQNVANKISYAQNLAGLDAIGAADPEKAQMRAIFRAAQKYRAKLRFPDLVIGVKVKDEKKAEKQVARLAKMAQAFLDNAPEEVKGMLKGRLKEGKVAGGSFLSLELEGGMIPMDMLDLAGFEEQQGEFADLLKHLRNMKLTVSFGVLKGHLLLGVTATAKDLEALAGGGKLLANRAELAPLLKDESRKVIGVRYSSKEMIKAAAGNPADAAEFLTQAKNKINKIELLKEERRKAIAKDLDEIIAHAKEIKLPEMGGQMAFSFMTKKGIEAYEYRYGDFSAMKNLKCTLHHHFGGDPIFAAAFAFEAEGKYYEFFSKYIGKAWEHGTGIFLDQAEEAEKEMFEKFAKVFVPLVKRLDKNTKERLIPSMRKGGLGIVLDGKWKSKQWHAALPPAPEPMPMAELGLLIGVSDGKKFASAMTEYRKTLNEVIAAVRSNVPNADNVPDLKLPLPDTKEVKGGTLYLYPVPEGSGLDKQFAPTAAVGKDVAVLALSQAHAERLLKDTKLSMKSGPLARAEKGDVIGVAVVNWEKLVDTALPWIEFNIRAMSIAPADDEAAGKQAKEKAESMIQQARVAARVFKAWKQSSSVTYLEGGAAVTHGETIIQDLDKVYQVKK